MPAAVRPDTARQTVARPWLMLAGVVLVSLNLRAAIAAVAPLLADLRADLDLSRGAAGLLTTLPVLCFGVLSVLAVSVGRRLGSERALVLAMVAIAVGSVLRFVPAVHWLFAGTLLIGAAMTVGNVLVPSVVKQYFDRPGTGLAGRVTGIYTAGLTGGAAVGAAVAAPLAHGMFGWAGLGWRGSLLAWAVPALLAAALWLPYVRTPHRPPARSHADRSVLRSGVTWALAGFMGTQALAFYAVLAWLPALLQDAGVSAANAGWALAIYNLVGIATALVTPAIAARQRDQRVLGLVICLGWAAGLVGLLVAPERFVTWSLVAGLAQGAGIGLALVLIVLRARTPQTARELSGTVQTVGYLLAAAGPFAVGALRDSTGSWDVPLLVLIGVTAVMTASVWWSGRDTPVG